MRRLNRHLRSGPLVSRLESPELDIDLPTADTAEATDDVASHQVNGSADLSDTNGETVTEGAVSEGRGSEGRGSETARNNDDTTGVQRPFNALLTKLGGGSAAADVVATGDVDVADKDTSGKNDTDKVEAAAAGSTADDETAALEIAEDTAKDIPAAPKSTDVSTLEELLGSVNTNAVHHQSGCGD